MFRRTESAIIHREAVKRMEELTEGATLTLDGTHTHTDAREHTHHFTQPPQQTGLLNSSAYELNACLRERIQHRSPDRGTAIEEYKSHQP